MKIFLIGLPGSGKTTMGRELAALLNVPFLDLDIEIERTAQRTIKSIFEESGQEYFRQLESEVLLQLLREPYDYIMATGGGTPCFFENMAAINDAGKSIFLDIPVAEIVRRLNAAQLTKRPLFNNLLSDELHEQIGDMRVERLPFYTQADVTVEEINIDAATMISMINA